MAVSTYWNTRVPHQKKLEHYLNWMLRAFRMSLPCIVYAIRLFGHNPLPKMMKFGMGTDEHAKHTAIFNMTWDLFHIDHFFKNWIDPKQEREEIFFTRDHMLRSLLRLAISVQYQGDITPLLKYLTSSQAEVCRALIDGAGELEGRVYGTIAWSPAHKGKMIRRLEEELFY
jgi:hypothetical protein